MYKRQEHLRTACFDLTDVAHGFIKKPFAAGKGSNEGARLDQRDRAMLEPVSYTHLDVYKRQPLMRRFAYFYPLDARA